MEKGEGDSDAQNENSQVGVDARKVSKKLLEDGTEVLETVSEKEELVGVTEEVTVQNEDGTIEVRKNLLQGKSKEEGGDEDEGEVVDTEEIVTELPDGSYEVTRKTRRKIVKQGAPPPELLEGADEVVEEGAEQDAEEDEA